jgi:hypothetical protein
MFSVGSNCPVIEKDPTIQRLRQDVANRMWDIIKDEVVVQEPEIKFVSVEDAVRELIALKCP